jgi:hypothetical protein
MATLRTLTLGILMSICLSAQSQINEEKLFLTDTSLTKKYCITVTRKDSSDSQGVWKYTLISNFNTSNPESLVFAKAVTHDIAPPVFFWNKNSTKLIYEDGDETYAPRQIKIYDLGKRKVVFSINGFINTQFEKKENFFDAANNILIFFTSEKQKEINIMSLDISNQKISTLKTISTSGQPFEEIWVTKIDKAKREMIVR